MDENGGIVRLGPLAHQAVWVALEAFLGRPMVEPGGPEGSATPAP
jgi:hypothetical protein